MLSVSTRKTAEFRTLVKPFLLLFCMLWLVPADADAGPRFKVGAVYTRAVVLDEETEQPILVEYATDGSEVAEVEIPEEYKDSIENLSIRPVADYQYHLDRLEQYQELHKDDLALDGELMNRAEFFAATFTAADDETDIPPPALDASIKSMYVRGQSSRILPDPDQLVLLGFPYDLTQDYDIGENDRTLVLEENGNIIASSEHNIAYRVGFFGDPSEAQGGYARRKFEDEIFGPVPFVKVWISEVYPGGISFTDNDGKYSFKYLLPPCPVGGFEFTTDVWAELKYRNFRPIGSPMLPYFLRKQDWDYCYAGLKPLGFGLAVYQEHDPSAFPIYYRDLKVDVMFLVGRVHLENLDGTAIELAPEENDITLYDAFDEEEEVRTDITWYDFNQDGVEDTVLYGKIKSLTNADGEQVDVFVEQESQDYWTAEDEVEIQWVFFEKSAADPYQSAKADKDVDAMAEASPDLVRVADRKKRLDEPVGQLQQISKEDYQNTDILVFRESTGQLITERRGLRDEEVDNRKQVHLNEDENWFSYRMMLRGPNDSSLNIGGGNRRVGFEQFAVNHLMTEPFQTREADHPKPGEFVRVVAINRATGYIGTTRVQLMSAAENPLDLINIDVPEITLRPPNLKIWAEREYEVTQGLTQDEERQYLIGQEGAGLTTDTTITVYTEWLDHDGTPLPEELGLDNGEQYGLTGRLAKIVDTDLLAAVSDPEGGSSDLAEFPIAPGRQIQALNIASNLSKSEHFYVHVVGTQKDETPVFDVDDAKDPPYDTRPALLTPFLVPMFDEAPTFEEYYAYRELLSNYDPDDQDAIEPTKPLPSYAWQYRPEYQFSQYELEMQNINRINNAGTDDEETTDILDVTTPVIASSDQLIEAVYSLISNDAERLTPIDGEQQLVLALGEDESLVTLGKDQTIRFENIEHLSSLDPEDYLNMRLYVNHDAANVLWEWAFYQVAISPNSETELGGIYEISVDDKELPVSAIVLDGNTDGSKTYLGSWSVEGVGSYLNALPMKNTDGIFINTLNLPTISGITNRVLFKLEDGSAGKIYSAYIETVPGVPANLSVTSGGAAAVSDMGAITGEVTVTDQFENSVEDGTPVHIRTDGDAVVITDGLTANGKVSFSVKGGFTAGSQNLVVTVGNLETSKSIEIAPIELTVDVDALVDVKEKVPVTFSVTSPVADDLTGLVLNVGATKGELADERLVISGKTAQTELYAGEFPGSGQVVGYFSGGLATANYEVDYKEGLVSSEYNLLVGDETADGSFSVPVDQTRFPEAPSSLSVDYVTASTVTIKGAPGEAKVAELGNLLQPNIEPVLHYSMNTVFGDNNVLDYYLLLNAKTSNNGVDPFDQGAVVSNTVGVSNDSKTGFGKSFTFDGNAKVAVQNVGILQPAQGAGFTLDIKPSAPDGSVVDYQSAAMRLFQSSGQLVLEIDTVDGRFSVTSDQVSLNEWHSVGAHYKDNKLLLQIDDKIYGVPASGSLVTNASVNQGIIIGGDFKGSVDRFSVFDWTAPALTTFSDGSLSKQITIGPDGKMTLPIVSTGKLGEFRASIKAAKSTYGHEGFLFESALAELVNPPGVWDVPVTIFFPDEAVPDIIHEGGYEAEISAKEALVKLVELNSYVEEVRKDFAIGFILGLDTGSTAGTVGDMVAGFFLLGDLRDAGKQLIYQLTDDEEYNQVVHILSNLGIITNLAEVGGIAAGGVPGAILAVIDGTIAAAKTSAKLYKASSPMMKVLGPFLSKTYDKLWENKDLLPLQNLLPFLEIYVAYSLMSEDIKTLFENAIQTEEDLVNFAEFALAQAEDEEAVAALPGYRGIPFEFAYAAPTSKYIQFFQELAEEVKTAASKNNMTLSQAGKNFSSAIAGLKRLGDLKMKNIANRKEALVSLVVAQKHGIQGNSQKATVDLILNSNNKLGSVVLRDRLFKAIEEIDWKKLIDELDADSIDVLKSANGPFGYLGQTKNTARAALMMFEQISQAQKLGLKVVSLEKKVDVLAESGKKIATGAKGTREVDMVLKTVDEAGKVTLVELKGWTKTISFIQSSSGKEITLGAGEWFKNNLKPGSQLFKDIILFSRKVDIDGNTIEKMEGVRWLIAKEGFDDLISKGDLVEQTVKAVRSNSQYFRRILKIDSDDDWRKYLIDLRKAMKQKEFFSSVEF